MAALAGKPSEDQGMEHPTSPYDSQATHGIDLTKAVELPVQLPAGRGDGMRRRQRRRKNTQRLAREIDSSALRLPGFRHDTPQTDG